MKRKIILFLFTCLMCLGLAGCKNSNDSVEIYNENSFIFDNVNIPIKDGYFYDNYEKFTVDENTIGVTIYFTNNDEWWCD